jgi:hypothetical protein
MKVEAARPAVNVGARVGHGAVRVAVNGMANRAATPEELARMGELVRGGMREGAFRLMSVPANYAPLDEVIDLARVAAEFGGIHQHVRDVEHDGLAAANGCHEWYAFDLDPRAPLRPVSERRTSSDGRLTARGDETDDIHRFALADQSAAARSCFCQ